MSRATIVIRGDSDRQKAIHWASKAPLGTTISYRRAKRTLPQNDRLWAMLTDVAQQVEWYGQKLTPEDFKDMFTASLRKARVVPGIDPGSFVLLGLHTSDMDKEEMGLLIALIEAFGAEHGVVFGDEKAEAA
jgi:hypothetical protein